MLHRFSKSTLVGAFCLAFVACMVTSGREAKSSLSLAMDPTVEFERPFRHNFPFIIRLKKQPDGTQFDTNNKPTVTYNYKDKNGAAQTLTWLPVTYRYSKSRLSLFVCVLAQDPRKLVALKDLLDGNGSGTGTIIVTTNDSQSGPIPVTADQDTEEYP